MHESVGVHDWTSVQVESENLKESLLFDFIDQFHTRPKIFNRLLTMTQMTYYIYCMTARAYIILAIVIH